MPCHSTGTSMSSSFLALPSLSLTSLHLFIMTSLEDLLFKFNSQRPGWSSNHPGFDVHPVLVVAAIWGVNQEMEDLSPSSSHKFVFQTYKITLTANKYIQLSDPDVSPCFGHSTVSSLCLCLTFLCLPAMPEVLETLLYFSVSG